MISVLIATYGDRDVWEPLSDRAYASAQPQLEEGDQLLRYHLTKGTLAKVRNELATLADKDWLCFLDGDDELGRGYLAAMRAKIATWNLRGWDLWDEPKLLAPSLQYVEKHGRVLPPALPNRGAPMSDLNHCVIGTLVPKFLFVESGGFRDDLPIYEDWALFLACVRGGATIEDVPDAVYRAHMRAGASRNRPRDAAVAQATYARIRGEHLDAIARGAVFI